MKSEIVKKYNITKLRIDTLSKINRELDNLYNSNKLDNQVIESLSKLSEINEPTQQLVYSKSILNYMELLKQS